MTSATDTMARPSGASSDSILKQNENEEGQPYNVFHDKNMQETWVELPDMEKHRGRR